MSWTVDSTSVPVDSTIATVDGFNPPLPPTLAHSDKANVSDSGSHSAADR
jgi:hypothetical protein